MLITFFIYLNIFIDKVFGLFIKNYMDNVLYQNYYYINNIIIIIFNNR